MGLPQIASYPPPTRTELAPSRAPFQLAPARCALLVHDVQDYFLDVYARQAEPIPTMLRHIQGLAARCRALDIPVIYTAQPEQQSAGQRGLLSPMWGPGLTAHPERRAIAREVEPQAMDIVLTKWRYSAFARTPLLELLQSSGRDQLIICGVYSHIGCQATACDAFMSDIEPFFVSDASADFTRQQHLDTIRYVADCCGVALLSEDVLSVLGGVEPLGPERLGKPAPR